VTTSTGLAFDLVRAREEASGGIGFATLRDRYVDGLPVLVDGAYT
jgi:hypothetical protein